MKFPYAKVHFVGIGGIGMSALARILISLGVRVTGSDIAENTNIGALRELGALVWVPHDAAKLPDDVELVVYTSAVSRDNPELVEASSRGVPLMSRGELLAEITRQRESLIVAGSHGKTTTTALLGKMLLDCGHFPTVIVGGRVRDFDQTNALLGSGNLVVAESDESDGSFLMLEPAIGILTNVDREHLSHYGSFEGLKRAFRTYLERVKEHRVVCMDDSVSLELSRGLECIYYSVSSPSAHVYAENILLGSGGTRFTCRTPWGSCRFYLPLPGIYNVANCLAAVSAALLKGCFLEELVEPVATFRGVERRLTVRGMCNGAVLVDDYAHHPTEIVNTLSAVRQRWPDRRVVAVFQPHRFSRMRHLWRDFVGAFDGADLLYVTDIYSAGEAANGFSMDGFLKELATRRDFVYCPSWEEMVEPLRSLLTPGDVLVTLGAGDIWKLCLRLAE